MGMVASCSAENCSGSLEALFDPETKQQDGFYCTRCGIVYGDVGRVNERPVGIEPRGRMNQLDETQKMRDAYEGQITTLQDRLDAVAELVATDKSKLAEAIRGVLSGDVTDETTDEATGDAAA